MIQQQLLFYRIMDNGFITKYTESRILRATHRHPWNIGHVVLQKEFERFSILFSRHFVLQRYRVLTVSNIPSHGPCHDECIVVRIVCHGHNRCWCTDVQRTSAFSRLYCDYNDWLRCYDFEVHKLVNLFLVERLDFLRVLLRFPPTTPRTCSTANP